MTDLNKAAAKLVLLCRDVGYEVGATLKPKQKDELSAAISDLKEFALEVKSNTTVEALNSFLYGVISALENPHQK